MSSTAKATWRMPGVFAGACGPPARADGVWNFVKLKSPMAVRGLQDRDLCPGTLETYDPVHPTTPDRPDALQLKSELDKERRSGRQIVNDDAYMLHS